jgi:hypothetical protein
MPFVETVPAHSATPSVDAAVALPPTPPQASFAIPTITPLLLYPPPRPTMTPTTTPPLSPLWPSLDLSHTRIEPPHLVYVAARVQREGRNGTTVHKHNLPCVLLTPPLIPLTPSHIHMQPTPRFPWTSNTPSPVNTPSSGRPPSDLNFPPYTTRASPAWPLNPSVDTPIAKTGCLR